MRLLLALILLIGLSAQAQITISNATLSGVTSSSALLATANNFTASNTFSSGMMIWGDANKTNGVLISPSGEVLSNAVGSVTIAGGNVTASGQYSGNGFGLSNVVHATQTISGYYIPPFNASASYVNPAGSIGSATEASVSCPFVSGGYLTNLIVKTLFLGTSTNLTVTLVTNAVDSNVSLSIIGNGGTQIGSDTTHSVYLPANQTISMKFIGNNATASNIKIHWSFEKVN